MEAYIDDMGTTIKLFLQTSCSQRPIKEPNPVIAQIIISLAYFVTGYGTP